MATDDFPFDRHGLNPSSLASRTVRRRRSVERSQARRSDMQIKETLDVSLAGAVESPPLEDVVALADFAGVACDDGGGLIASRCVEIPLVGSEGEVSGILCHTGPRCDTRGAVGPCGEESVRAIADVAQVIVH